MKTLFSKIPKPLKISLLVIIIPIAILFIFNKTGLSKKLLNHLNKEMIEENNKLKEQNESIQNQRTVDSTNYVEELEKRNEQIEQIRLQYNSSLITIRKYEKAINNYRSGDFNNNFVTFTGFITSTDTLQLP